MRSLVRSSLALIGLTLAATTSARAQDPAANAPAGYQVAPSPGGLDGKPVAAGRVAAPHRHKGRVICANCLKKQQAQMMPEGVPVACAHSQNGVCPACKALLALPGTVTVGAPTMAPAPGHAVASAGAPPSMGRGNAASPVAYDPSGMPEPAPIGVIQANYAQGGAMGMPAPAGMARGSEPGRAMVSSGMGMGPGQGGAPAMGPGPAPVQKNSGPFPHPQIIGHLFGLSGIGNERSDAAKFRKKELHAMTRYDNEGTTVNELPASTVFGKR